jgi:glycosyltransferase involved in cell wall biosynthesis
MQVQIVDPSAFTPPYDHALCAALARAGVGVELVTSRFLYGPVPEPSGYRVTELFYRRTAQVGLGSRLRLAIKGIEHGPGMARLARHTRAADLVHYQWLTAPSVDLALLPKTRPRVYTIHYPLPSAPAAVRRERRLPERFDALVVHTEHGAAQLRERFGVPAERVNVIHHGAFDHLAEQPDEQPLPEELAGAEGPVILFFGLLRPYKGLDVLLDAFQQVEGAELWIAGMPRMETAALEAQAAKAPGRVRFVKRFVTDPEIPAFFNRADVVVLPYRDIEQSGVLYTALAFGKPMVLSDVGGFREVAAHGCARLVPPGEPEPLAAALNELVSDGAERDRLAVSAREAAAGPYSWDAIGKRTLALYEDLVR